MLLMLPPATENRTSEDTVMVPRIAWFSPRIKGRITIFRRELSYSRRENDNSRLGFVQFSSKNHTRIRFSLTIPTRITFLCVILVCHKFRLFLVHFPKSNSRLRKAILVSTRILVFSLSCEKGNSRIYEKCHIRGEKHTILGSIYRSENHTKFYTFSVNTQVYTRTQKWWFE